jgi:uncharacterized protein
LALNPGDIAFVGFNADGNDNIAFVTLADINPGEIIVFEDNEWNGTTFADTSEGAFSWTATSLVTAGTIVLIDNVGSGTIAASTGTATTPVTGRGTNRGISASGEAIYAYQGTATSPTFLTAIANSGFNATNGILPTGLTAGTNAIDLSTVVANGADIAAYTGNRSGQTTFASYLALINNPANWVGQDGTGDQSIDGTAPDVPFSATAFATGTTPPPSGNAPAIAVNSSTTNFLDGGSLALLPATVSGAISGVINDPTDPAKTLGVDLTLSDSDTPVGNLTVTVTSSNQSVVPNANLALTGTGASRNLKINPTGVGLADITVTVSDGSKTATYTINYAASAASTNPASTRFLTGTSDASTAIALDSTYMLVGDDEDQTIRLYDRTKSGLPVNAFNFTSSLGLSGSSEVDIEASTRVGNTIYWMGSHSNNSSGSDRPNRERIFSTSLSGSGANTSLSFNGYYQFLEDDLIAWDNANGHGLGAGFLGLANSAAAGVAPEQTNGFNIEGLTFAPNGTTAYVAFRAPNESTSSRDKALIVPVTNFTTLISATGGTTGSATFGAPIQLDLGGRGIRSIERNSSGQYLIIAGPAGSATGSTPSDFRLYTWTGNATDTPVLRAADLTTLNSGGSFESIVEVPSSLTDSTKIEVLVDNGDTVWYNNGTASKDLSQDSFQKFRSEVITLGNGNINPGGAITPIYEIQGAGHTSPLVGQSVIARGIVTAVDTNGFYLQDVQGDNNIATSDAIFVFTSRAPGVTVGTELQVAGAVSEFIPGGAASRNLSTTQISGNPVLTTLSTGNPLPAATIVGAGGRVPPTANIDDDAFSSFDPATDGIDFFESMEAMRVTAQDLLAVSGTNEFGEIFGVVNNGAGATGLSDRKTLNISPTDFNPERVQIQADSGVANFPFPKVTTGDRLGNVTGVVGYGFGNYEIVATENFTSNIQPGGLQPEVSATAKGGSKLTVASYNVLNLDPNEADGDTDIANGRFAAIAQQIVTNLNTPDIIGLQEIQDNSGSANDGVTAADVTLQTLVTAIAAAGGPTYSFIDNTFIGNNLNGGQPGGNIRTAFLYDPSRVNLVNGSVQTIGSQATGGAFAAGRLPLVATFGFNGQEVTVVNNHFSSKGGSAPILGTAQPFEARQEDTTVNGSLDQRQAQSLAVQGFVNGVQSSNSNAKVVVLGDFNEFEFVSPVKDLATNSGLNNLTETLPENERYSYNFQGNSQSIDHILVSNGLKDGAKLDVVHVNSEFAETNQRASDHDPSLVSLTLGNPGQTIVGTQSFDFLTGGNGDDTISGLQGNDFIFGGSGNDSLSGDQGQDFIYGDTGNDILLGGNGTDFLFGGLGDDSLLGGEGQDFLNGDAGNDTLLGGNGADTMLGSAGDDKLLGENGNDVIIGGRGDDLLVGGAGNDYIEGGNGLKDTAEFDGLRASFSFSGSLANLIVRGSALGTDTLVGVEFLKFNDGIVALSDVLV